VGLTAVSNPGHPNIHYHQPLLKKIFTAKGAKNAKKRIEKGFARFAFFAVQSTMDYNKLPEYPFRSNGRAFGQ
jgi:hypothetical protein